MTPDFMIDTLQQELAERAEQAFQSQYLNGFTDADCGRLPTFLDDAYLTGYIAKLRELPTDAIGRILHPTPQRHFAFGYMDGIGDSIDGESNLDF
jgi:hypothetical protein